MPSVPASVGSGGRHRQGGVEQGLVGHSDGQVEVRDAPGVILASEQHRCAKRCSRPVVSTRAARTRSSTAPSVARPGSTSRTTTRTSLSRNSDPRTAATSRTTRAASESERTRSATTAWTVSGTLHSAAPGGGLTSRSARSRASSRAKRGDRVRDQLLVGPPRYYSRFGLAGPSETMSSSSDQPAQHWTFYSAGRCIKRSLAPEEESLSHLLDEAL